VDLNKEKSDKGVSFVLEYLKRKGVYR